jgi:hypothetical protein
LIGPCCREVGKELGREEEFKEVYDMMMGQLLDQIRLFAIYYCSKSCILDFSPTDPARDPRGEDLRSAFFLGPLV